MRDVLPDFDARLARAREEAIRAKREGVLLIRRPVRLDEEPRSYIGGLPRLPQDLEWPVSTKTGRPFSFVAQIDLRDVPRPAGVFFPAKGLLWFFADFSENFFKDRDIGDARFPPQHRRRHALLDSETRSGPRALQPGRGHLGVGLTTNRPSPDTVPLASAETNANGSFSRLGSWFVKVVEYDADA